MLETASTYVRHSPARTALMTATSAMALALVAVPAGAQTVPANPATPAPADATSPRAEASSTPQTEAAAPPQAEPDVASDIVVTASRTGGNGFVAPTPTVVLGGGAIDQRQSTNVAQILDEVPAFKATTSPSANAIRTQTPGANTADLRGLGAARTLVLVNGARIPPLAPASNGTGTTPTAPDLNIIPTLMIDRVEVVTGGASAQWGSDAVAGVVNIILKNHFEGLEIRAQSGISDIGDAGQRRIGILGGFAFKGGDGHIVGGVDYTVNDEVGDIYTRSWGSKEYGRVANAAFATNGQAANIITTGVHAATSQGGLITGPANFTLRNNEFTSATTVSPFDIGGIRNTSVQIGGQGQSLAKGVSLAPGVERVNPFVRAEYRFSDAFTLILQGAYSYTNATLATLPPRDNAVTIFADNPYIPGAVRTALGALPSFTISRVDYDIGNARVNVVNKTPTLLVGGSGDLGGGWAWDGHIGWGENDYTNQVPNNRNIAKYRFATDAVTSNGQVVCRATLPGAAFNAAAAGCVPIDLFGNGTPSAAAIGYVTNPSRIASLYTQKTAAANLRGAPFSTWAGPVRVAVGAEYRRETERVSADAVAQIGGNETSNATAYYGAFDVKEGYVEVVVPLARDVTFLHSLDLNGAVRVASYSTAGTQTTWKGGATWEPVEGLRFRATRSRDIRAPAIFELFATGAVSNLAATVNGVTAASIPQNSTIGTASLRPEKADTLTAGVVLQPRFLPGFALSVDYFNIKLKDAITVVSGATAGTLCTAGQTYFCSLFTYAGTIPIAYNASYLNAASIHPSGVDIVGSYRLPLDRIGVGLGGALTLAFSGTYTFHYYSNLGNGSTTIDYAGDNSSAGVAKFRSNTSLTYDRGGFSFTGQVTTISAGAIDKTANLSPATSISNNYVPPVAYLNIQTGYDVTKKMRLFAGVNNLLDKEPPALPSATVFALTNGVYYDTLGRTITVGVNLKF